MCLTDTSACYILRAALPLRDLLVRVPFANYTAASCNTVAAQLPSLPHQSKLIVSKRV